MPPTYRLVEADTPELFAAARVLIQEYGAHISASTGADLCFQNFAAELNDLSAMYGPPSGCLLLAGREDGWVGCCGLRRFSREVCEMKRLFIQPGARGGGLGHRLIERLLAKARGLGYRRMVLDTLADMTAAQALYRAFGFRSIEPYYCNPIRGASYMELDLAPSELPTHRP